MARKESSIGLNLCTQIYRPIYLHFKHAVIKMYNRRRRLLVVFLGSLVSVGSLLCIFLVVFLVVFLVIRPLIEGTL